MKGVVWYASEHLGMLVSRDMRSLKLMINAVFSETMTGKCIVLRKIDILLQNKKLDTYS